MFAGEDPSAASGVWRKRPRSRPHLRRGRRNLEATRLARPTRLPSRAKVHARRAVWAAWVLRELLSDSHVRAIAELGSNFDACMRAAHAGVKEKRSARLPGSLKRRVSSIMETSRNYSNAELRKVSVRDRGRECCATGWHEGRSENRRGTAKRDRRRQRRRNAATFTLPYVFVPPPSGCSIFSSLSRLGGAARGAGVWGAV